MAEKKEIFREHVDEVTLTFSEFRVIGKVMGKDLTREEMETLQRLRQRAQKPADTVSYDTLP